MDNTDIRILKCLKDNSRMSASAISHAVGLSVSSVTERIKKLEHSGIIKKYTVLLDNKKLGNNTVVFMQVGLDHQKYGENFATAISGMPNVISCNYVTGEYDFLLKIITDSPESVERIHRRIKNIEHVASTKTYFVLDERKDDVSLIPEEKND